MRFRLQNDPTSYNINRNKRDIAALDEENDAFVTASSQATFTNKQMSYDQLTGVPVRLQADFDEDDDTSIAFIKTSRPLHRRLQKTPLTWSQLGRFLPRYRP